MAQRHLSLAPEARERIVRHAQASRSREACGVLLADARHGPEPGTELDVALRAIRVPNRAADRERSFLIHPIDLARVERVARAHDLRIIGTWHTHPHGAAEPSRADRAGAPDGWWQLVAGRSGGNIQLQAFWVEDGVWIPEALGTDPASCVALATPKRAGG